MFDTAINLINECEEKNKSIAEVVIDYQLSIVDTTKERNI